jgi:aminomethyltransferase
MALTKRVSAVDIPLPPASNSLLAPSPFGDRQCPLPLNPLLTTPLNALHIELGARMVPFAGYSMPVQYPAGLMAEHHHTRKAAGLFDVSHMGQLRLVGPMPLRRSRP